MRTPGVWQCVYVVVEESAGLNPMNRAGQIHGAWPGDGEALGERLVYDETGQRLTGSLMDYALPAAADLPSFDIGHRETPSPLTPGGYKGMGEGGTIGAPAAIANAVADAVAPLGVAVTALPILPASPATMSGAPAHPPAPAVSLLYHALPPLRPTPSRAGRDHGAELVFPSSGASISRSSFPVAKLGRDRLPHG